MDALGYYRVFRIVRRIGLQDPFTQLSSIAEPYVNVFFVTDEFRLEEN